MRARASRHPCCAHANPPGTATTRHDPTQSLGWPRQFAWASNVKARGQLGERACEYVQLL